MTRLCTICARGGSKGLKNKNIRPFMGKPLLAHSIQQARESGLFDAIAVSSDSADILAVAKEYGAHFMIERPAHLATDTAAKTPVIQHALAEVERQTGKTFETIVDLPATGPLRAVADIQECVAMLESKKISNVLTATECKNSPYFSLIEMDDNGHIRLSKPLEKPITCRQDSPKCFDMNGSVYVWTRTSLMSEGKLFLSDTGLHVMPTERSIDIDTELDFELAEFIAGRAKSKAQR